MMERREFIQKSALTGMALALANQGFASEPKPAQGSYPKRPYKSEQTKLSIIGFGGIVVMNVEQSHADKVVAESVERGVNYFDVAPSYGNAEDRLGPALAPFRKDVFLACKTQERSREGAERELHASLKKMRTDHFDLYQLHALSKMEDLDKAAGPNGALEAFVQARQEGKIRFIGFSAHSAEVALAALDRFDFDSILFPFNFVCWHEGHFGPQVLEKAKAKGAARLALKAMAYSPWPEGADRSGFKKCWYKPVSNPGEANRALRFTLSQDITAAIPPGEESLFQMALDIAEKFEPLTSEEMKQVQQMAQGVQPIFRAAV
ncbi:MAG: aldo/keto reductase [Candidatus Hinthialibacter sp.]